MAFEPVFEMTKLDSLRRLCSSQAVVEAKLLPSSGATIARVLSIATDCTVSPSEVFAGEARYNGRVCFKVVFADGEGGNHSMDYNADFTDKLACEQIVAGIRPVISASILDTDVVSVDEREIKLACVVEVNLDAVMQDGVNVLTGGGENVYTHDDKIEYTRLVAECSDSFTVSDSMSDVKCKDVLLAEPKIVLSSVRAGLDSVTVSGKIICDLCCEGDDGLIMSYRQTTAFMQEVPATGARDDNFAVGSAMLTSYKAMMETSGEDSAITLDYGVAVTVKVFADESVDAIVDAFSVTNELLTSGEALRIYRNRRCETFSDRIDGSVTLDINMPIADNILAVTGAKLNIASATASDGKINFEGVASCNVIYYSAEADSNNSVAVELPFSFKVAAGVNEGDEVTAKGVITSVSTKIRRGNEIDIKAEIEIETLATSLDTKYVITELKLGEERALPTSAFSIHIARGGETLWDVAKSLGTTPELVLTQNPKLSLPLSGGERVIAYRNLK